MARLDLIDLNLFRHVAEAGSITAGAGRANLALASASARVRRMEAALGVVLLQRGQLGSTLTPAGHSLLGHARGLLAQAERMHEAMGDHAGGAGHVRLLCNTNALVEFLPEPLGRFMAASPGVTVDVQERLSDEIVALVGEGAAELGIVAGTVETEGLETIPFRTDRFVLVLVRHHALAAQPAMAFAAVLGQAFVGLDQASALQRFLAERAARMGQRLRLRVQLRSFEGVCRMVEAGLGIGVVPETTARRAAQTMAIGIVPLSDAWAARDLRLCMRSRAGLSGSARRLMEALSPAGGAAPAP